MDYKLYDRLQAELGGISDSYKLACTKVLQSSELPDETRNTLLALTDVTANSLQDLAENISATLIAASK